MAHMGDEFIPLEDEITGHASGPAASTEPPSSGIVAKGASLIKAGGDLFKGLLPGSGNAASESPLAGDSDAAFPLPGSKPLKRSPPALIRDAPFATIPDDGGSVDAAGPEAWPVISSSKGMNSSPICAISNLPKKFIGFYT